MVSPFERAYAWHVPMPLDVGAMAVAAAALEGPPRFRGVPGGPAATRTTDGADRRAVARSSATPGVAGSIVYEVAGDGFLRHMVRTSSGTLVEIGRGRRPAEWMGEVLASRDRAAAGPTAPPQDCFSWRSTTTSGA